MEKPRAALVRFRRRGYTAPMRTRLHALRKARGFTLEDIAALTGQTTSTVQRHETDQGVKLEHLEVYAELYGLAPRDLLMVDDEGPGDDARLLDEEALSAQDWRLAKALHPGGHVLQAVVAGRACEGLGLVPGMRLLIDPGAAPALGQPVLARTAAGNGPPRLVLRVWQPPFLMPQGYDPAQLPIALDAATLIGAVVRAVWQPPEATGAAEADRALSA